MRDRLLIRSGRHCVLVRVNEIDYIEAMGNYVRITMGTKSYVMRHTLHELERMVRFAKLIRINRSVIINIDRIKELKGRRSSSHQIVLDNDRAWSLGRKYRRNLRDLIVN